jgi:hypothetical protein
MELANGQRFSPFPSQAATVSAGISRGLIWQGAAAGRMPRPFWSELAQLVALWIAKSARCDEHRT